MPDNNAVNPADETFLAQARACAAASPVRTSPNPKVGCVIVDGDGAVIATGVTEPAGGRHAERVALDEAGAHARGATVYVTLEPCNHHGRTPPCTDALRNAGVNRVVYVAADVNPVAGGGTTMLRTAGISVAGPLPPQHPIARDVADDLAGFLTAHTKHRPHVTLKLAQDAAGNTIPPRGGYLTGDTARRDVHRMRSHVDAVLVGANTVTVDNPALTARGETAPAIGPRAVIFDRSLTISPDATVCRDGTILVTADTHTDRELDPFRDRGVTIHPISVSGDDVVDVRRGLGTLLDAGILTALAEPGRTLATQMLVADVVDVLVLHVVRAGSDTFTPCVPLATVTEVSRQAYDATDMAVTYRANRKMP